MGKMVCCVFSLEDFTKEKKTTHLYCRIHVDLHCTVECIANIKSINFNNILVCIVISLPCKATTKTEKHNLFIGGWTQTVETHPSELLNKHNKKVNCRKYFNDCLNVYPKCQLIQIYMYIQ